jgi:hypothetical protein
MRGSPNEGNPKPLIALMRHKPPDTSLTGGTENVTEKREKRKARGEIY